MANVSSIKLPNNTTYNIVDKTSGYTKNTGTITKVQTTAGAHTTINVSSGAAAFNVPTKTSHLTNDSGFLTSHQTLYEANLNWGGKDFSAGYSPIDAAMIGVLGANRFAFLKAAGLTIEYSTDGGTSYTDYGATDAQKVGLFSSGLSFYLGKHTSNGSCTTNDRLRVTIDTGAASIYTSLNKIAIYMSTSGATVQVLIEKALQSTPTTFSTHKDWTGISGWSGWNILNISGLTTYGNSAASQYGRIRFTFRQTAVNTNYTSANISKIMGFGGVGWTTPSIMAATGHLYSYDSSQNATFPAQVTATQFNGALNGNASTSSDANNLLAYSGNEVTIGANSITSGASTNDTVWINYRDHTGGSISNNSTKIVHYHFGNRKGNTNDVILHAASFDGNVTGTALNVTGTVAIANGGTGQTTAANAINALLNGLPTWEANPTDTTYFIRQDTGGSATYGKVAFSTIWNYISGKLPEWSKASTKPSYTFSEIGSKPTTLSGYGITDAKIASGVITLGSNTITPLTSSSTLNAAKLSGAIPSAVTATTQASTDNSTKIATTAYVTTAIANLPEPMVFKGSVGTGGTVTSLPTAAASNEGWTYKVITALSSPAAKVGDTVISNGGSWVVIPSGDEPSGTVTSVGVSNATNGGLTISGSPITSSGSITIGHSNVLTSAQTTQAVYPIKIDKNGHISAYGSAVTIPDVSGKVDTTHTDTSSTYGTINSSIGYGEALLGTDSGGYGPRLEATSANSEFTSHLQIGQGWTELVSKSTSIGQEGEAGISIGSTGPYLYANDSYIMMDSSMISLSAPAVLVPTPTSSYHAATKGYVDGSQKAWYGYSSTTASTAAKTVTCSGFKLSAGVIIGVNFSTANTAATPTLNVNKTGAKSIYVGQDTLNATTNVLKWSADTMIYFMYDGTEYRYMTAVASSNTTSPRGANTWYGTSNTTASAYAKTSTIDNYVLTKGSLVTIAFSTANTYVSGALTLNINSTNEKYIYYNNARTSSSNTLTWEANSVLTFMFDGSYYHYIGSSRDTALAGTVTSVGLTNATNGGLSISGSPITGSGTITVGHSNILASAQTTQAVYPIKIDKNGHISAYGSAVSIPTKYSDLTNDGGFYLGGSANEFTAYNTITSSKVNAELQMKTTNGNSLMFDINENGNLKLQSVPVVGGADDWSNASTIFNVEMGSLGTPVDITSTFSITATSTTTVSSVSVPWAYKCGNYVIFRVDFANNNGAIAIGSSATASISSTYLPTHQMSSCGYRASSGLMAWISGGTLTIRVIGAQLTKSTAVASIVFQGMLNVPS